MFDVNDQLVYYGAVSRFGEIDRYNLSMGRLMAKDYEMKTEDLSKLYSLLPADVQKEIKLPEGLPTDTPLELPAIPKKSYTGWLVGGAIVVFAISFSVGYMVIRKSNAKNK